MLRYPPWVSLSVAFGCLLAGLAAAQADEKPLCRPAVTATVAARAVNNDGTIALVDGRAARLAGVEIPSGGASHSALEAAIASHDITISRLGPDTDRYGRISGLISALGEPLQRVLLAQGLARVAARVGDHGCAAEFLAAERAARAAGLGLWSDPTYLTRQAESPADVLAQRGHFALVEGTVLSVREVGGTIYVNFGRRWSEDFTVTVAKRNERRFSTAGLELKKLAGQYVRVRGTIEERGGPWIEAANPEQIEIAERH